MGSTLAVVEVQPAIDQLPPGSPLAGMARRRFGGKSLLEWVIRRASDAERLARDFPRATLIKIARSLAYVMIDAPEELASAIVDIAAAS